MFTYMKQVDYPACVGMSRAAGRTYSLWNDLKGPRKLKWYYNLIPFRFLTWDRKGVRIKIW